MAIEAYRQRAAVDEGTLPGPLNDMLTSVTRHGLMKDSPLRYTPETAKRAVLGL
jgi:hypothetical protein